MCDGLKFEPDPSCVRAGFRNPALRRKRSYRRNLHPTTMQSVGGTLRTPSATLRNVIPLCQTWPTPGLSLALIGNASGTVLGQKIVESLCKTWPVEFHSRQPAHPERFFIS